MALRAIGLTGAKAHHWWCAAFAVQHFSGIRKVCRFTSLAGPPELAWWSQ